jgi:hypothetical protein
MSDPVTIARQAIEAGYVPPKPPLPRTIRAKRAPRRVAMPVSGLVWSLIGAAIVGGAGNMFLIVTLALVFR